MTRERQEAALTAAPSATARERERSLEHERGAGEQRADEHEAAVPEDEALAPLLGPEAAAEFRTNWDAIQVSFVDNPRNAVRRGDELVARVMKSLAQTFSQESAALQDRLGRPDETTENLRVALRRYRSFFERLLSL